MKYNDNGTYKDIYVKAFDTLPVGTEVDYDGETVPSGWTEVADPNTYSTNEVKIGTWIDGKPLYRKVIQTTIPTSGNNQNVSFQNNIAIMKSVTGFALQSASGGVNLILPYISMANSWSIYTYYNRANQELVIENSGTTFMNNTTCYLIAEYTKTTD